MLESVPETARPAAEKSGATNTEQSEEQPATGYMQGWALASLTAAFMAICFVLAIDNTILGSSAPDLVKGASDLIVKSSDGDTPDHQRLPEPERYRMVWFFLLDRADGTTANLRPLLCFL